MTTIALNNGAREVDTADLTDDEVNEFLAHAGAMDDEIRERCHGLFAGTGDGRGFVNAYAQMHQRRHGTTFMLP